MAAGLTAWAWRPDVLLVVGVLGFGYAMGWTRLRRRASAVRLASGRRLGLYLTGLALVVVALLSPIASHAPFLFTLHMVQHELLTMAAAPLLLLADPLPVLLWALPRSLRHQAGRLLVPGAPLRVLGRTATRLPVAWLVFMATLWGWHYPPAYEAAVRSDLLHDLQHASLFAAGLLFWCPVVNPAPRLRGHVPYGYRILYILAAVLSHVVLVMPVGLLEPRVLYPSYSAMPRVFGLSVLEDQVGGWAVMGLWEGLTYMGVLLGLFGRMLAREERLTEEREAAALHAPGGGP